MFDSHAHYDDKQFDEDRDILIPSLFEQGVKGFLNASSDISSSYASLALAHKYENVYAAVGVHPHEAAEVSADWLCELDKLSSDKKAVAIGEIGLDYHYDFSPRETQRELFAAQMEVAAELGLPVIIHEREALTDTLDILRSFRGRVHGVFHCFSNSLETARIVLDLGYDIALGGTVTFKNARHAPLVAAGIPADRLLVETDCPYMAPVPMRGQRNDSSYLSYIIEKIAEVRQTTFEAIVEQTYQNGCRLFGIN